MADVHRSPGFYPAPDHRGEQWWNGVSWSETRRNAAAPARPVAPLIPLAAPAQAHRPNTAATLGFVLGIIGLFAPWVGVAAVIVSFLGLRRGPFGGGSRFVAVLGLLLGVVGAAALIGESLVGGLLS